MVTLGLIGNGYFQPAMEDFFTTAAEQAQIERQLIESIETVFNRVNETKSDFQL